MCVSLRGMAMGVVPAILVHAVPQPLFFWVFKQAGRLLLFFLFLPPVSVSSFLCFLANHAVCVGLPHKSGAKTHPYITWKRVMFYMMSAWAHESLCDLAGDETASRSAHTSQPRLERLSHCPPRCGHYCCLNRVAVRSRRRVLSEHPVHPAWVAACSLDHSRLGLCANCFFPHVPLFSLHVFQLPLSGCRGEQLPYLHPWWEKQCRVCSKPFFFCLKG